MRTGAAAVAVTLFCGPAASGGDVYWTNTVGGVLSDVANWRNGACPTADDLAWFDQAGTYTVRFTEDAETKGLVVKSPGAQGLDLTFELGGHAWNIAKKTDYADNIEICPQSTGDVTWRVNGGAITNFYTLLVGGRMDGTSQGAGKSAILLQNAELIARSGDRTALMMGAWGSKGGIDLQIRGGAKVKTAEWSNVGYGNTLKVSGAGSRLETSRYSSSIKAMSSGLTVEIEDGGSWQVGENLFTGLVASDSNDVIRVREEGSSLRIQSYDFAVGAAGSQCEVHVEEGACLSVNRNSYVGGALASNGRDIRAPESASNNWFRVYNAAYTNNGNLALYVLGKGNRATFGGSRLRAKIPNLEVRGESTLEFVLDESGIAPLNISWAASFQKEGKTYSGVGTFSGGRIVIDATRYVTGRNATRKNEFVLMKGSQALQLGATSVEDFAKNNVSVLPDGVKYELSIDAKTSTVSIRNVRLARGLVMVVR